jgi:hypothetical protein
MDQPSDYQLLSKDSAEWNWSNFEQFNNAVFFISVAEFGVGKFARCSYGFL